MCFRGFVPSFAGCLSPAVTLIVRFIVLLSHCALVLLASFLSVLQPIFLLQGSKCFFQAVFVLLQSVAPGICTWMTANWPFFQVHRIFFFFKCGFILKVESTLKFKRLFRSIQNVWTQVPPKNKWDTVSSVMPQKEQSVSMFILYFTRLFLNG